MQEAATGTSNSSLNWTISCSLQRLSLQGLSLGLGALCREVNNRDMAEHHGRERTRTPEDWSALKAQLGSAQQLFALWSSCSAATQWGPGYSPHCPGASWLELPHCPAQYPPWVLPWGLRDVKNR